MRGLYLRVGVLLLAGAALLVGAVLFFSSNQIRHGRAYETYFRDSVQGLDVGAPVKYRGVSVGAVTFIGLVAATYGQAKPAPVQSADYRAVLVRFEVDTSRIGEVITPQSIAVDGLRTRIAPQGLTGQSYIEIDFANPTRYPPMAIAWTPQSDYIPSIPSTLSEVKDGATELLGKLQHVDIAGLASGVLALTTDLHAQLHDGNLQHLLEQTSATMQDLRGALAAANVPALAADLRQTLAATRAVVGGPQVQALLRSATVATDRLTQATARLPALLATLDTVARRADSGSADLEAGLVPMLRDAHETLATLREITEAVRRDPSQVVLQGPPPRTRDDGGRP